MPHYSDIPHSNINTDRVFDTLLQALEEIAPGIRANLKLILEWCLPGSPNQFNPGTREDEIREEKGIAAFLELPPEEKTALKALAEWVPREIGDRVSVEKQFDLFPCARRLKISYGLGKFLELLVRAGSNLNNGMEQDCFSAGFTEIHPSGASSTAKKVSGNRYIHPSRAGSAQPPFADALRSYPEFASEVERFASAIGAFREQIQYIRSDDSAITARFDR